MDAMMASMCPAYAAHHEHLRKHPLTEKQALIMSYVDTQHDEAKWAGKLEELLTEAKKAGQPVELGFLGMDGSSPLHLVALRGFHLKAAVLLKHGAFSHVSQLNHCRRLVMAKTCTAVVVSSMQLNAGGG